MADHPQRPGRKRSEASHRAILDTTWTLLGERGYAALTMDEVAVRAGVGKQTIYRWWRSKGELVLEALTLSIKTRVSAGPTLRKGLEAYLGGFVRSLWGHDGVATIMAGLMADSQLDPAFSSVFREQVLSPHRTALLSIFRHHNDGSPYAELLVDMALGAIWYRVMSAADEIDDGELESLARDLARLSERHRERSS
ncbi:MAG: TetR/AcrR family transcriptional regulator [Polyangiaceae bacterium]